MEKKSFKHHGPLQSKLIISKNITFSYNYKHPYAVINMQFLGNLSTIATVLLSFAWNEDNNNWDCMGFVYSKYQLPDVCKQVHSFIAISDAFLFFCLCHTSKGESYSCLSFGWSYFCTVSIFSFRQYCFFLKWRGNTKPINLWKKGRAVSSVSQPSPSEKNGGLLTADPLILLTDKHRQTQTQQQHHFAQTEIRLDYS